MKYHFHQERKDKVSTYIKQQNIDYFSQKKSTPKRKSKIPSIFVQKSLKEEGSVKKAKYLTDIHELDIVDQQGIYSASTMSQSSEEEEDCLPFLSPMPAVKKSEQNSRFTSLNEFKHCWIHCHSSFFTQSKDYEQSLLLLKENQLEKNLIYDLSSLLQLNSTSSIFQNILLLVDSESKCVIELINFLKKYVLFILYVIFPI